MRKCVTKPEDTSAGFTLIELSIVLVIIGLIVGGVLVGQDLIKQAQVRAQISQIEKFNTAVNTFYGKYQMLPGDMNPQVALAFGFATGYQRNGAAGMGDGNGIIQGVSGAGYVDGVEQASGETTLFWSDLTYANGMNLGLIPGSFTGWTGDINAAQANLRWPDSPLGGANSVYVYGGELNNTYGTSNGFNYYGLSAGVYTIGYGIVTSSPGLSVGVAYSIDKKMDDSLPQSGRVTTQYLNWQNSMYNRMNWAAGGGNSGPAPGASAPLSSTSCYDNSGNASSPTQYSVGQNSGVINCALSFQFQ